MQNLSRTVFVLAVLVGVASAAQQNPVQRVIALIGDLEAKIIRDGHAEDLACHQYEDFCASSFAELTAEINTIQFEIEDLSAVISSSTSETTSSQAHIMELTSSISTNDGDLTAITVIRDREHNEFLLLEKELIDVVDTLERAINIIERNMRGKSSALLQARVDTQNLSKLMLALNSIMDASSISIPDKQKLTALVQQHAADEDGSAEGAADIDSSFTQQSSTRPSGVIGEVGEDDGIGAPSAAAYKHESSHSILDVLEDLLQKAQDQLAEVRQSEATSCHHYDLTCISIKDEIASFTKALTVAKVTTASYIETKATSQGDLSVARKTLAVTRDTLDNLKNSCRRAHEEHETIVKSRQEELRALAEAKRILSDSTGDAQTHVYGGSASFLQISNSGGAASRGQLSTSADLANFEVVRLVRQLAEKEHSPALTQLAGRLDSLIRAGASSGKDPFVKVRGLISDMIERLTREMESESTHKDYCDREMAHATDKKESLSDTVDQLSVKIDKARALSASLKADVAELQAALAELARMQLEMDKIRAEEEAAFSQKKQDLQAGIEGVRMASKVLREHYANAAALLQLGQAHSASPKKALTALVQQGMAPPVDPDVTHPQPEVNPDYLRPAPQPEVNPDFLRPMPEQPVVNPDYLRPAPDFDHDHSYTPSSGAGQSIIDMLEVVEGDFSKDLAEATAAENQSEREYQVNSMKNKLDKAQKENDIKHKNKETTNLDKKVAELSSDREGTQDELDAILKYLQTLTASCIGKAETYEERKRRRDAEIAGLKEALSILQGEALLQRVGGLRGARTVAAHK